MAVQRMFHRTIGIDYSGAATPITRTAKLQVYRADGGNRPQREPIPEARRGAKHWHRRQIAEWLVAQLSGEGPQTLVGIDHAFSFPTRYFHRYNLHRQGWGHFLDDFREYWPTDDDNSTVEDIRYGIGQDRAGDTTWKRVTDLLSGTAKSPFHFDVQGSVAKSTHAGIPWLLRIREQLGDRVHFWPFDGWNPCNGKSVIAEVYPALWSRRFRREEGISDDEHDAYSIAAWLAHADQNGWLPEYFNPNLSPAERAQAHEEGWILGVLGYIAL